MRNDSGATTSIWMATAAEIPSENNLLKDAVADVCIVGAGIAGMTTAYLLAREGNRVIVLDDGPIGGGMTGRTTAHRWFSRHRDLALTPKPLGAVLPAHVRKLRSHAAKLKRVASPGMT